MDRSNSTWRGVKERKAKVRRQFSFSKDKFLSLTRLQQHKKCAELLKELYVHPECTEPRSIYNQLCCWMELPPLALEIELEKRFHEHLRASGVSLSEHNFLHTLTTKDTSSDAPWLSIHTYLDGLRSCHNVGSIIRTVEAFRLGPVHLSPDMMDANHPQIQKTSMGTWPLVTITHGKTDLPRPWIGVETISSAPSWHEYIYPRTCSLFLGNEERGLSHDILNTCDQVVRIPLVGQKNSLNVANAFAIIAAEIARQQRT